MNRREFLISMAALAPARAGRALRAPGMDRGGRGSATPSIRLFLGGDVMTGRAIDQILPTPGNPRVREPHVQDATEYLALAESVSGPIPGPATVAYPWEEALAHLERAAPDVRIINLETSVTESDDYWPRKSVHYRMHPANVGCLKAARIDCCVLANNHVLDWGYRGLDETLETLRRAGLGVAGAGQNLAAATAPSIHAVAGKGRVLVYAFGSPTSGIPPAWAARRRRAGVNLLTDFSDRAVRDIADTIQRTRRQGDIVVLSIHWGPNWGYAIADDHRAFAHKLIEAAGVDLIHGHSSHHPKGVEVYKDRLILYGCGDLLNDYEGISGYEQFRDDLPLMYLADMDPGSGSLIRLELVPLRIRKFRLNSPSDAEVRWLVDRLGREFRQFGHGIARIDGQSSTLLLVEH
jgi:poly-gamma-glutamate synthesis protein (capsule biosynthesis protein)